jgi:uncharacterized protein YjbJ (UPF0337 family)
LLATSAATCQQLDSKRNDTALDGASGVANEAIGKARDRLRSRFRSVATKGAAQEIKGNAESATGHAKDAIKKSVNKGAVNKTSDIYS